MKKTMQSRFAGKCSKCPHGIQAGNAIVYDTDTRTAAHVTCPDAPEPAPPPAPVPTRKSVAEVLEKMGEIHPRLSILRIDAGVFKAQRDEEIKAHRARALEAYGRAGGCTECKGEVSGWTRAFTTEYPWTCKEIEKHRAGGFAVTQRFEAWCIATGNTVGEPTAEYTEILREIETLEAEFQACRDKLIVRKGCKVSVVKGRKIPKGTAGVVFWIGDSAYGSRVGFKSAAGETFWTALHNVEVTEYTA